MTRRPRRNHSPAFKAKVALAAIRGEQTLVELSQLTDFRRGMTNPERLVLKQAADARLVRPVSEDAFAIVLRHLIENTIVHGRPSTPIEIILHDDGPLRIINGGPVLNAEGLASVRKRFKRGQTEAAGSGLGLSIVDRLLGQMNGRLVLLSPVPGRVDGFEARIELPAQSRTHSV